MYVFRIKLQAFAIAYRGLRFVFEASNIGKKPFEAREK